MFDCPEAACTIGGFYVGRCLDSGCTARVVAAVAQLVERLLGKDEVMGSNPISSWFGVSWWLKAFPAGWPGRQPGINCVIEIYKRYGLL